MKKSLHFLALGFLLCLLQMDVAAVTVTSTGDSGAGSLRDAIVAVPSGGSIDFAPALSGLSITLLSEIVLGKTVTVDASTLPAGLTITGGAAKRLFSVTAAGNLTLRSLTLTGGNGTGAALTGTGGALYNAGIATLDRCTLSGNSTTGNGGAIRNDGTLTLTQCTLSDNLTTDSGGAIANTGTSPLTLTHCTVAGNTATNFGGGIFISSGMATVTNSIVSGNAAASGKDIWSNGPTGGITRVGANIIPFFGKTPSAPDNGPAAITADPLLGVLDNNGGPTKTMALLAYSQAINAVPAAAVVAGLDFDQRGGVSPAYFPRSLGSAPDLGAYESGDAVFTASGLTLFARVPVAQIGLGFFEVSDRADFSPPSSVSTLAGVMTGMPDNYGSADGPRLSAKFNLPSGVAQDSLGNIFVADTVNNVIRMQDADGLVSTIAGDGTYGLANGPGLSAQFAFPSAIAVGADDNVYVSDTYNHRIAKLTRPASAGAQWTVTTLAGTGIAGFLNGAGSVAKFNYPYGLDLDGLGNVYVTDALNHRIRKVTPAGSVSTFAGLGTAGFADTTAANAMFDTPQGLVISGGSVYVADRVNNRIRAIATTTDASGLIAGAVSTLAGSGTMGFDNGATPALAKFNRPSALVASSDGKSLYIADEQNHAIRKVTLIPAVAVTTEAGTGAAGFVDALSGLAKFNAPTGLLVARDGTLVVADSKNHLLRSVNIAALRVIPTADPSNIDAAGELVSAPLNFQSLGLLSGTRYYFRYRLSETSTVFLGDGQTFTQVDLPIVVTVAADNKTPTAGRLNGTIAPKGLPTSVAFEYSTEPDLQAPFVVTPVAGSGAAGFLDSATASLAQFHTPEGLAVSGGSVYVADFLNHRIRKINAAGAVSTFVGSSLAGLINGTGGAARFDHPAGIAAEPDVVLLNCATVFGSATVTCPNTTGLVQGASVSGPNIADGATILSIVVNTSITISATATGTSNGLTLAAGGANFYVADEYNHCIRKISASGVVTILAGSGVAGFADGAAGVAKFLFPAGLALDAASPPNVYVADMGNHCIRKVAPDGTVTTFAGSGISGFANGAVGVAQFASPEGVAVNPDGDLLVADTGNHLIRKVSAGSVATFAGSTQGFLDAPDVTAMFNSPSGIAVAADGAAFVTDSGNHRIRRVGADAVVSTYAGSGIAGAVNSPASGLYPISATQFNLPTGVAVDGAGGVFVTQEGLVRKVARKALPTVNLPPVATVTLPPILTGVANKAVGTDLSGLLPGATYYFRVKGTCLQATVPGAILSFATPAAPITVNEGATIAGAEVLNGQAVAVDFGETPLGTPFVRQFLISNPNGTTLTVTAINLPAGYDLTLGTGVNVIPPGGTLLFAVRLQANATGGAKGGNVVINSDAPGLGTFIFPITGLVLAPPAVTTLAATGNAAGNATLNGTVNPLGSPTDVWFQWSLTGQFDGVEVSALAGSVSGFAEGIGAAAKFNQPYSMAVDTGGVVFVADTKNHRIRRIALDGTVSTFAGTGTAGLADGPGATAQFNEPTSVVFGSTGTLFVCDSLNHRICAITAAGDVRTYAGFLAEAGFTDGVASAARFSTPWGLAIDAADILYVADRENHRIRKVALDGSATTLAGTGTAGTTDGAGNVAQFNKPLGIALDAAGFIYVTESTSHAIRKIAPDGLTSVFTGSAGTAGFVNGTAASARFSSPVGLAVDGGGSIFVADKGNHSIRKITSTIGFGGAISVNVVTFAGLGTAGTTNGLKGVAQFDAPISVVATEDRGAIVGELTNSTLRRIVPTEPLLVVATGLTGTAVIPVSLPVTGLIIGNLYHYRTVGTNVRGTNFGNAFSILAGTPFELWQLAEFGANADPLIAGEAATPAHDGISNRIKYALGLDPLTDSVESLPDVAVVGGALTLTYNKVLSAIDILYTVEWTSDLITWQTAGITQQSSPPNGATQQFVASIPIAPHRVKFLRLNVTFQSP